MAAVPLVVLFLCRDTARGSLLALRCDDEEIEKLDCSERMLSRLDVRLMIDGAGVDIAIGIGIRDGLISRSPRHDRKDDQQSIQCNRKEPTRAQEMRRCGEIVA